MRTNGKLDDEQMQLTYDLLGVPHALCNGSDLVPAAGDAPAWTPWSRRELARHHANLERTLNDRDKAEQASEGLVSSSTMIRRPEISARTRSCAGRRMAWAVETIQKLRAARRRSR